MIVLTLPSFGQSDTTQNNSVECIPTPVVKLMIQDIVKGDYYAKQVVVLDSALKISEAKVSLYEKERVLLTKRYALCESTINEYVEMDSLKNEIIDGVKAKSTKFKRQRNALLGFAAVSTAAIIKLVIDSNKE
jgi:hypothetical protein